MNQEILFSWVNVVIIDGKTKQQDLRVKSVMNIDNELFSSKLYLWIIFRSFYVCWKKMKPIIVDHQLGDSFMLIIMVMLWIFKDVIALLITTL